MRALCLSGLLVAGFLVTVPALSQDHLTPEPSIIGGDAFLSDYDAMVVDVFHEAYDRDVMLRMIVEPSSGPESVVGVKQDKDASSIFMIVPEKAISLYDTLKGMENGLRDMSNGANKKAYQDEIDQLRAELPKDYHDLKLHHCRIGIDSDLAARITKVWRGVLLETQFVQPAIGPDGKEVNSESVRVDGVDFHFFLRDTTGFLAGKTWSPDGNKPAMLVDVAEAMADYCEKKDGKALATLNARVDALAAKFKGR